MHLPSLRCILDKIFAALSIFFNLDWYFVILLCCFPLRGKITENLRTLFPYYRGSKSDSRNIFPLRGPQAREVEEVSRITFWTKIIGKNCSKSFRNFSKKCMKTIKVMQQSIFFYFGIDWNILPKIIREKLIF